MRCPSCKNRVLQKSGSTTKLRTKGPLFFTEDGECRTQCYWCKSEVTVPIEIKGGTPIEAERFILPKRG